MDYERKQSVFTFEVKRVFKGTFPARVRVLSYWTGCASSFARDTDYIVFTHPFDGNHTTNQCAGNRPERESPDWQKQLGPGTPPAP